MKLISKVILLTASAAIVSACVENRAGYSGHHGYSYNRYTATPATSGYNSHYNQNKTGHSGSPSGGYSGHGGRTAQNAPSKRWYRGSRSNNPPIGYRGAPSTYGSTGSNTYTGSGYQSHAANNAAPPSTTSNTNSGYAGR